MVILVVVGTPAAYVLARGSFRGSRVLNTLVELPIVLPPSAAGIALLLAFGRFGLLGEYLNAFGITLSFTTVAVVMAEVFVAALLPEAGRNWLRRGGPDHRGGGAGGWRRPNGGVLEGYRSR